MVLLVILCILLVLVVFLLLTKKYRPVWKMYMVFGKKGSGKSTFLIKKAYKLQKRGYTIYTNMLDCMLPGVRIVDLELLGDFTPEPLSVCLWDEVGMIYDNRNYKNFRPATRDWYKLQRHYKCIVYLASQTWDVDAKLRNLTDGLYLCLNVAGVLSVAKRITRKVVLTESTSDSESRISENLQFTPIWNWSFTWIPRWKKYFDSFTAPELPPLPYREVPPIPLSDGPTSREEKRRLRKLLLGKRVSVKDLRCESEAGHMNNSPS